MRPPLQLTPIRPWLERLLMMMSRMPPWRYFMAWSLIVLGIAVSATASAREGAGLDWSQLPPLPDKEGFGGMYGGVSGGTLIAAGGSNFPDAPPWEGGRKQFYDSIFVLKRDSRAWLRAAQTLPRPLAYGVSITCDEGILCLGGCDAQRHYADAFLLRWEREKAVATALPPLPKPCAQMCGALVGSTVYVAGGLEEPDAVEAMRTFWALDLARPGQLRRWEELPPWPGPARMQAVAAAADGSFFLLSGIQLQRGPDGKPRRITPYLRDAYRYTPAASAGAAGSWRRIADPPRGVAAAPTPAVALDASRFAVLGGLDAAPTVAIQDSPPLPLDVTVYDTAKGTWSTDGRMPQGSSRVTVPTAPWQGGAAVLSGERLPGRRSPAVWLAVPRAKL